MDMFTYEILDILRKQFTKIVGEKMMLVPAEGRAVSAKQFGLKNVDDNLFDSMAPAVYAMFSHVFGTDTAHKLRSIRSSAAMTYNLLGNGPVTVSFAAEDERQAEREKRQQAAHSMNVMPETTLAVEAIEEALQEVDLEQLGPGQLQNVAGILVEKTPDGEVLITHPVDDAACIAYDAEAELRRPKGEANPLRHVLHEGRYHLCYEKEWPTFPGTTSPEPIALDAWLQEETSGDVIACEMKMTEWLFSKPSTLQKRYLEKKQYRDTRAGEVFTNAFKKLAVWECKADPTEVVRKRNFLRQLLLSERKAFEETPCECVFRRYDAFQMMKHALACYYAIAEGRLVTQKLTLVNCIWTLPDGLELTENTNERYCWREWTEYKEFRRMQSLMEPIVELFASKGVTFAVTLCTVDQFLDVLMVSSEREHYLQRYFCE